MLSILVLPNNARLADNTKYFVLFYYSSSDPFRLYAAKKISDKFIWQIPNVSRQQVKELNLDLDCLCH